MHKEIYSCQVFSVILKKPDFMPVASVDDFIRTLNDISSLKGNHDAACSQNRSLTGSDPKEIKTEIESFIMKALREYSTNDMEENYIYYSTCFEKEQLRKQVILLNENSIDFRIIEKSAEMHFRAPLSGYFEAEIHILDSDYEKADELLSEFF